jgi:hypothetical protein
MAGRITDRVRDFLPDSDPKFYQPRFLIRAVRITIKNKQITLNLNEIPHDCLAKIILGRTRIRFIFRRIRTPIRFMFRRSRTRMQCMLRRTRTRIKFMFRRTRTGIRPIFRRSRTQIRFLKKWARSTLHWSFFIY